MRIDSSGNVGIGTTSIESFGGGHKTLEVSGSTNTQGGIFKTATSGSAGSGSSGIEMLMYTDSVGGNINVSTSNPLLFFTANTERMRLNSSGNLLIASSTSYDTVAGATAITPRIQVHGTSLSTSSVGQYGWNTNPYYTFNKSGGGIGTYTALASGDALGQIQFNGTDGAGFFIGARIQSLVDATPSTGIVPGRIIFQTTNSSGNNVERMRIASTGAVNIGAQGASTGNDVFQIGDVNTDIGIVTLTTISGIGLRYDAPTTATANQRGLYVAYNGGNSASPYTTTAIYGAQFVTYTKGTNQTVTNGYGVYIDNVTAGSSNNYGLYIAAPSGATNNYGIAVSGTSATNYFQGSIGVGTVTPDTKLHVYESTGARLTVESNAVTGISVKRHSTDSNGADTYLYKSRGTATSPTAIASGDLIGVLYFTAYGGTNDRNLAYVSAGVDTYTSDSNISSRLSFSTSPSGSAGATERMRIDQEGCVYIMDSALWQYAPAHTAKSATATLTAAELKTGIIVGTGTSYTLTMPTGTNIDAAFTGVPTTSIGFDFYVVSGASGTITMAVNTGVTNSGGLTIGTGQSAHFRLRRTAANTYVMYRLS